MTGEGKKRNDVTHCYQSTPPLTSPKTPTLYGIPQCFRNIVSGVLLQILFISQATSEKNTYVDDLHPNCYVTT